MKKIEIGKKLIERNSKNLRDARDAMDTRDPHTTDTLLKEDIFAYKNQLIYINKLFLEEDFDIRIFILREIAKKLASYKKQDIEKQISLENLINLSETIEKLVASKLKCIYCKEKLLLLYKNQRDERQWTLDRIDNDLGHSCANTLIACLKCNLQRRRRGMEAFKFTKQLRISKSS
jgi:hypothetical protein